MSDSCKDKVSLYQLRDIDGPIFEAAAKLAMTLKAMPECTQAQADAIDAMSAFISSLPTQNPNLHAEFGFRIEALTTSPETPLERTWCVTVCRSMLEVFSMHSDFYASEDDEGSEYEFEWLLCPGSENRNSNRNAKLWISQVADPKALVSQGYVFSIETATWRVK